MQNFNPRVFFPPFILLVLSAVASLIWTDAFLSKVQVVNTWILGHFDWLFSWSTFLFLVILAIVYFSPMGKRKIGGENAQPILSKWRWFSITLCTTIATGILFWGAAEPLYHLNSPPNGITNNATFALSTMWMHWTFTPYGIYTITGLLFAWSYYTLKQPFSLASLLYPLLGKWAYGWIGTLVNIVCLYALVAGMSASLGTGILTLSGGLHSLFGITETNALLGLLTILIVGAFSLSAATGLMKGIQILSDWNIKAFIALAIFVFVCGPTLAILQQIGGGLMDYVVNFVPRSLNINSGFQKEWLHSWTIFYWANWFAWAPISALFLGRLAVGYSVRSYIHYNLIFPSLFSAFWMLIFSGTVIHFETVANEGVLSQVLNDDGAQNVIYAILNYLPFTQIISCVFLLIAFLSYVTAADSNTSAMSGISAKGISPNNPEAPLWIQLTWGILIGLVAWIMVCYAGIDGIKLLCTLGGFPALFVVIAVALGLLKLVFKNKSYHLATIIIRDII